MIDGFSILLPTFNMIDYLKLYMKSIEKNSELHNEVCIVVDGSRDGTREWLDSEGYNFVFREHKGSFSAWNLCGKMATKDFVLLSEDDFYYLPGWDVNLAKWIEDLPDSYIVAPQIIEPFKGSYLHYDCGDGPAGEPFDEEKLLKYAESVKEDTVKSQSFSMFAVSRKDWIAVKGYDESYDPACSGTIDLSMKLHTFKRRRWVIANNSFIYHFKPQNRLFPNVLGGKDATDKISKRNTETFIKKWGMTINEAHNHLDKELEQCQQRQDYHKVYRLLNEK